MELSKQAAGACSDMRELEQFDPSGMSNFDHSIEDGFEEALRAEPNKVFGRHAGWNFNSKVWFDGEQFRGEVWVYRVPQEILTADSLQELMDATNERYGAE